ncbi:hypothetical protein Pmani_034362 [Petrolisthes manimaculis]|uniref:Endonuclease/exonuclease/phosphatase domain-containing protein n=1 Tax=Petrolisthes manimaculis TaxID=1843537 RepID=A0AAE1NNX0_9EUCA|nr:hypothetical protein Pmani_034362 [Petrolisthes manimaculis]
MSDTEASKKQEQPANTTINIPPASQPTPQHTNIKRRQRPKTTEPTTVKVIQHNVLHWRERKTDLANIYRKIDPDIILINSHGIPDNKPLHLSQYRIHRKNTTNTHTDGTAIAIKHNIQHKIIDNFISDTLAVEIDTSTGKIIIATLYQPPARPYIPIPDFLQLFRRNTPVYMLADLNANHHFLGYRHTNTAGRQLYNLTLNRTIQHIGPHFPTYYSANSNTTPDIILTNFRTHHNTHTAPGPLTTSVHIPIIFTISASPIQIPSMPRPSFKQANWASFKTEISENINSTEFPDPATLEDIDTEVEKWHETIKTATKNNIPTTRHRTLPTPKHSHETNTIMIQFTALRTHAHIHGWTRQQYNRMERQLEALTDLLMRQAEAAQRAQEEGQRREERLNQLLERMVVQQTSQSTSRTGSDDASSSSNTSTHGVRYPTSAATTPYLTSSASLREFDACQHKFEGYVTFTKINMLTRTEQRAALTAVLDDEWTRTLRYGISVPEDADLGSILDTMGEYLRNY